MAPRVRVPDTFDPIDEAIDEAWEPLRHSEFANRVFYAASEAGNFSLIWHGLAIVRAVATRDLRPLLRTSSALGLESAIVNGPLKSAFDRERPEVDPEERPHRLRQPLTSSFPSGHASAAVVAASFLCEGAPRGWRWAVRGTAVVVATSRIHVRIHHGTDVAAGAAAGWVLTKALRPLVRRVFG